MSVINENTKYSVLLPEGKQLTIAPLGAVGSALVFRKAGVNVVEQVSITNSQTYGPYQSDTAFEIQTIGGPFSYVVDLPTMPLSPRLVVLTQTASGRPETWTEGGVECSATYNADDTVATLTKGGVTQTYSYDGNGNLIGAD